MIRLVRPEYVLEFSTNREVLDFLREEAANKVSAPHHLGAHPQTPLPSTAQPRDLDMDLLRQFVLAGATALDSTVITEHLKGPTGNELRGRGVAAGIHAWAVRLGVSNEEDEHAFERDGRTWRLKPAAMARARTVLDRRT